MLSPTPPPINIKLPWISLHCINDAAACDSYNCIKGQVFIYVPAANPLFPLCVFQMSLCKCTRVILGKKKNKHFIQGRLHISTSAKRTCMLQVYLGYMSNLMCIYIAKEIHFSLWRETFHWRNKKCVSKKPKKKTDHIEISFSSLWCCCVFPHDRPSHQNSLSLIAF